MRNVLQKGADRSLSIAPIEQSLNPAHHFARVDLDACGDGGFIQDELPHMGGVACCLKGTERPIGVPQEKDRILSRVYQSQDVFDFPLDAIRLAIPTASTSSPIKRIDGEVLLKSGKDGSPSGVIRRCPMNQHERRPCPTPLIGNDRSVFGFHGFHHISPGLTAYRKKNNHTALKP
jgi:hypothetical protein